ncbi:MAG: type II toxin-antitoxin system VapC family toxin [Chloroflexi bacterium]|nr:type II toxin-antitoxin system VapC family toxin [Chloroflexota bacterium]
MIFIDSNVPMYLAGAAHPNKPRTAELLEELSGQGEEFVTDVEVYQEILHRYTSIRRLNAADDAFDALDRLVEEVLTFGTPEIRAARVLVEAVPTLSARDALHAVVMYTAGVERIISFDHGFDACPGIERLE